VSQSTYYTLLLHQLFILKESIPLLDSTWILNSFSVQNMHKLCNKHWTHNSHPFVFSSPPFPSPLLPLPRPNLKSNKGPGKALQAPCWVTSQTANPASNMQHLPTSVTINFWQWHFDESTLCVFFIYGKILTWLTECMSLSKYIYYINVRSKAGS